MFLYRSCQGVAFADTLTDAKRCCVFEEQGNHLLFVIAAAHAG